MTDDKRGKRESEKGKENNIERRVKMLWVLTVCVCACVRACACACACMMHYMYSQENVLYDLIGRQDKGLASAYQVC
jgi:hypothetical protein